MASTLTDSIVSTYTDFGGRAPNAAEIASWTIRLQSGSASIATLRAAVIDDAGLGQVYIPAAIAATYQQYGGRAPNAAEVSTWVWHIRNAGDTLITLRSAVIDDSGLGKAYLPKMIADTYQQYGGRAPTTAEVSTWTWQLRNGGETPATLKLAVLNDAGLGQTYLPTAIANVYQSYGGRAPTGDEVASWSIILRAGGTIAQLQSAVANDVLGQNYLPTAIDFYYREYGGRAPTSAEIVTWMDVIQHRGYTLDTLRQAVVNDVMGQNYLPGAIAQVYRDWGGRAPSAGEITYWVGAMRGQGETFAHLKTVVIDDVMGQTYLPTVIAGAYQSWGGRAPNTGEVAYWMHAMRDLGATPDSLKAAILNDPLGASYATAQLTTAFTGVNTGTPSADEVQNLLALLRNGSTYADAMASALQAHVASSPYDDAIFTAFESYAGRAPNFSEYLTWRSSLTSLDTAPAVLKAGVIASSAGQAYLGSEITAIYQGAAGRAPTNTELTIWKAAVTNGSASFEGVRNAAIGTAADASHVAAAVTDIYSDYLGRAPTSAEQQDAATLVGTTHDIRAVGRAAFSSAEGIVHFFDTLHDLYPRLLGRDYNSTDQQGWFNAIYNDGESLSDVRAALMLDPSSNVVRYAGTPANDTLVVQGLPTDVVISQFDPAHDVIRLDASLAGTNLLDAAHAREISIDGNTPEVLITYGANQTLLLHGVHLAQLTAADFVFG